MSLIFKSPEAQKWAILGIKAALTALAVLPQVRKQYQQQPNERVINGMNDHAPKPDIPEESPQPAIGVYGLLLLSERGEVLSSYRFDHDTVNRHTIDREEIQRVALDAKAYAAAITYDRKIFSLEGTLVAEHVVPLIADALSDVGVRVFQRAHMGKRR